MCHHKFGCHLRGLPADLMASPHQVSSDGLLETERSRNATCARMERHNFEVSHVGFGSFVQATREGRLRRKRPRERFEHRQQVYVFFSFFNAGYKPNARSHTAHGILVLHPVLHPLPGVSWLHPFWGV